LTDSIGDSLAIAVEVETIGQVRLPDGTRMSEALGGFMVAGPIGVDYWACPELWKTLDPKRRASYGLPPTDSPSADVPR
jgi:hypothetical protein